MATQVSLHDETSVLSLVLSADLAVRHRIEYWQRQRILESEILWQATIQVAFGGSFENLPRDCLGSICRVTGWPAACLPTRRHR